MSQINTSQTIFLSTTLSGGVQPYDPCATWTGNYVAGNGATGMMPINSTGIPGTPYIETTGPCVSQGPTRGSLTGKFYPNGFTGTVNFWTTAKDASGLSDESNQLTYDVVALSALTVNAGTDQFVSGNPPTIFLNAASVSGGSNSYTYSWDQSFSNPDVVYFNNALTLNPSPLTGAAVNGAYTFNLNATDTVTGLTGSDSIVITVSGNAPPSTLGFTLVSASEDPVGTNPRTRSYVWQLAGTPSTPFTISLGIYSTNQKWNTTSNNLSSIGSAYAAHLNAQAVPASNINYQYTWYGLSSGSFKPVATWNSVLNQLTFKMNWGSQVSAPTMTMPAEAVNRTPSNIWGYVP